MRSILSLINKYFWKGMIGPVFSYLVPMILVLFIGRIMGPTLVVPGIFLISPLCILLVFMPQSIFEFRNSSLLKRIGTTPIKPWKFLLGISIFNFLIVTSSFFVVFVFCFAVFADVMHNDVTYQLGSKTMIEPSFLNLINNADWGSYVFFCFVITLLSTLIGLFIASIAKSTLFIQCLGISLMLVSLFVGPCILPIALVGSVDVVKYLGYLIPLKYPISCAVESFTSNIPNSIVNLHSSTPWDIYSNYEVMNVMVLKELTDPNAVLQIKVFNVPDKLVNIIMPWVFIFIFAYLVAATFRWNNRGKVVYRWKVISELINFFKQKANLEKNVHKNNLDSKYILEVKNLTRKFKTKTGELVANDNICFKVKKGRNLAILGHNGAGKSVLVETIVGVTKPNSGEINYNFEYIHSFNEKIGIQFQDSSYPYGIRVRDVILFFIKAYKLDITENELEDLIKKFGIEMFFNKNAGSLSGGQQQRINLLLSVLHKPKVLFLDELSTGLDIKIRNEIKTFIKKYAKENGMSIIIVSHDMNEVEYLADDIMILKDGKVQDFSSKKKILKENKNLESYIYKYL